MNAKQLLCPGDISPIGIVNGTLLHPVDAWVCGKCSAIFLYNVEAAERCCVPRACDKCGTPEPTKKDEFTLAFYGNTCISCWLKSLRESRAKRLQDAEKLDTWDGWVYDERGSEDGYFRSLDAYVDWLVDHFDDKPEEWPEYVHVCKAVHPPKINVHDLLESYFEEMYEEAAEHFEGFGAVQKTLDDFVAKNQDVITYYCDDHRAVRVPSYRKIMSEVSEREPDR